MSDSSRFKQILSGVFAGVGIGLLLGLIMGLSVSPTVLTVMGALTGLLGALLGLEHKIGSSKVNDDSNVALNIKVGSFGFAVIAGIFFGMTLRTHNMIGPSVSERIEKWVKAGYDPDIARKYVAYELLSIDPNTGSATITTGDVQKGAQAVLFNAQEKRELAAAMDTTLFDGAIKYAIKDLKVFNNEPLDVLLETVSEKVPEPTHMAFLATLRKMLFYSENNNTYCEMDEDVTKWKDENLEELRIHLDQMNDASKKDVILKTKSLFCKLNEE